ncbi:MAG: PEGA domain-containing protein [Candidatus Eisenbacteria bacterium]|nr:PEGA domain-containing protein [Candidatus Eisenbacteria bacterium]
MIPSERPELPVRIEVGTSEIEGGQCRAWADPSLVVAAVAMSYPEDTFTRQIEPRLADLDQALSSTEMGELPPVLSGLLTRLKEAHVRLYQDNRSLRREPSWVELACAVAEEDRVYFVRTSPAWICLIRDGKAMPAERGLEEATHPRGGLGSSEKLRLEVTSLDIEPGDIVLILASESNAPPDLRAIARLFVQTLDLKRACDGVVNLLGLQSQGASAVAVRFVPVVARRGGENALAGLIDFGGAAPTPTAAATAAPASAEIAPSAAASGPEFPKPLDAWAREGGSASAQAAPAAPLEPPAPASPPPATNITPIRPETVAHADPGAALEAGEGDLDDWNFPWEAPKPPIQASAPASPAASAPSAPGTRAPELVPSALAAAGASTAPTAPTPVAVAPAPIDPTTQSASAGHAAGSADTPPPAVHTSPEAAFAHSSAWPSVVDPEDNELLTSVPRRPTLADRRAALQVPILISIVIGLITLILLLLAAVPALKKRMSGGMKGAGSSQLWIESSPAAHKVWIDGVEVADGTPARLEGLRGGKHQVRLDLGICGSWETEVKLAGNRPVRLAPKVRGAVAVVAADPSRAGSVWIQGKQKLTLPARLDSLPVGWVRLFYEDEQVALWDRQVLVRADQVAQVVIPNQLVGENGLMRVEALAYREGDGLRESEGDSVFVDHAFVGVTPLDRTLEPGLHSVRVVSEGREYVDLVDLRPGGLRYVAAQFGLGGRPRLAHVAPGRAVVSGPVPLLVQVRAGDLGRVSMPTLHFPDLEPGQREVPLSEVEGEPGTFAGLADPRLRPGQPLRYYFSVTAGEQVVHSDLYSLEAQSHRPSTRRPAPTPEPIEPPPLSSLDEAVEPIAAQ